MLLEALLQTLWKNEYTLMCLSCTLSRGASAHAVANPYTLNGVRPEALDEGAIDVFASTDSLKHWLTSWNYSFQSRNTQQMEPSHRCSLLF